MLIQKILNIFLLDFRLFPFQCNITRKLLESSLNIGKAAKNVVSKFFQGTILSSKNLIILRNCQYWAKLFVSYNTEIRAFFENFSKAFLYNSEGLLDKIRFLQNRF